MHLLGWEWQAPLLFKESKTCSVFLSGYRNMSESLEEREMLWEHELLASVSTAS